MLTKTTQRVHEGEVDTAANLVPQAPAEDAGDHSKDGSHESRSE